MPLFYTEMALDMSIIFHMCAQALPIDLNWSTVSKVGFSGLLKLEKKQDIMEFFTNNTKLAVLACLT